MTKEYSQLVKDTLSFLKADPPKSPPTQTKPKPLPPKPKEKKVTAPEPVAVTPLPEKQQQPLFERVRKHLSHMRLIENVPKMQKVAIVATQNEDLVFLKNLAKAIQERFCPTVVIEDGMCDHSIFCLIIAQKNAPVAADIWLESIDVYQNNTEQKKQLWTTICHQLSSKSS